MYVIPHAANLEYVRNPPRDSRLAQHGMRDPAGIVAQLLSGDAPKFLGIWARDNSFWVLWENQTGRYRTFGLLRASARSNSETPTSMLSIEVLRGIFTRYTVPAPGARCDPRYRVGRGHEHLHFRDSRLTRYWINGEYVAAARNPLESRRFYFTQLHGELYRHEKSASHMVVTTRTRLQHGVIAMIYLDRMYWLMDSFQLLPKN